MTKLLHTIALLAILAAVVVGARPASAQEVYIGGTAPELGPSDSGGTGTGTGTGSGTHGTSNSGTSVLGATYEARDNSLLGRLALTGADIAGLVLFAGGLVVVGVILRGSRRPVAETP